MPADDYVPQADDPLGGPPILFRPSTFAKHEMVLSQVEGDNTARYPRPSRERTVRPSAGQWGYLASGHTISAASGLSLGSGTVTLCSRSGFTLTADGEDVSVLNPGASITGPVAFPLLWTDGAWSVCGDCGPVLAVGCMFCKPCQLPTKDLRFAYTGVLPLTLGSGSGALVYDSGTSDWLSSSFEGGFTIDLQCVSHVVTPRIMLSGVSQCTFGDPVSTNCNSLTLIYNVPNPSAAYTAGFRNLTISDPGPATPCPVPCPPCVTCTEICDGISLLPGGTITDDNGSHPTTGSSGQITGDLVSAPVPIVDSVGCLPLPDDVILYSISAGCNLFGNLTVQVNFNREPVCCNDTNTDPPTPRVGWTYLTGVFHDVSFIPAVCASGTLSGTKSFGLACADPDMPFFITSMNFSCPSTVDPMCQSFLVVGCNGLGVAGATVNLYDVSGGTLLFSGTTNSGGGIPQQFFANAPNPFWIEVPAPSARFQDSNATHTLICDSPPFNQTTITLPADSDHVCVTGCASPLAKTLHATHPTFGAITLVYNAAGSHGAGWYVTISYNYVGCRCCPNKTVTVTGYLNTSLVYTDFWKSN